MILLDSNIFIIDRFFKRDAHYGVNRQAVSCLVKVFAQDVAQGRLFVDDDVERMMMVQVKPRKSKPGGSEA